MQSATKKSETKTDLKVVMEWDGKPIPMEKWGKDHISTLIYLETVCVDHGGKPVMDRMRSEPGRPRRGWDSGQHGGGPLVNSAKRYPTRLKDGTELFGHDDWDCAGDMEVAGLLEWGGTGMSPVFKLTDFGWKVAGSLRRQRAEGRRVYEYELPKP